MNDIVVIVPSRGRPERCADMINAINNTTNYGVEICIGLDDDDPQLEYYYVPPKAPSNYTIYNGHRRTLSEWTNWIALSQRMRSSGPQFLVSMGDDHIPRTKNWHLELSDAILQTGKPGFAYGTDGTWHASLCTSWMVSTEIVKALGWMMLPTLNHMFVDNVIMDLGNATDRIVYCPDVLIEHVHPYFHHDVEWDQSYQDTNDIMKKARDERAYKIWKNGDGMRSDIDKVMKVN